MREGRVRPVLQDQDPLALRVEHQPEPSKDVCPDDAGEVGARHLAPAVLRERSHWPFHHERAERKRSHPADATARHATDSDGGPFDGPGRRGEQAVSLDEGTRERKRPAGTPCPDGSVR